MNSRTDFRLPKSFCLGALVLFSVLSFHAAMARADTFQCSAVELSGTGVDLRARFAGVTSVGQTQVDLLAEVVSISGGAAPQVSFECRDGHLIGFVQDSGGGSISSTVRWRFVKAGTEDAISLRSIEVFALDIDGATARESVTVDATTFSTYALETPTQLSVETSGTTLRFRGPSTCDITDVSCAMSLRFGTLVSFEMTYGSPQRGPREYFIDGSGRLSFSNPGFEPGTCGNGSLDAHEVCDDANTDYSDACDAFCCNVLCDSFETEPDAVDGERDTDSDGDGIEDGKEVVGPWPGSPNADTDQDGVPDWADPDIGTNYCQANTSAPSRCESLPTDVDTDADGIPNHLDRDSDGDTVIDYVEAHDADFDGVPDQERTGRDTDGDGLDDAFDANCAAPGDCTNDILGKPAPRPDLDGDGQPNFLDIDDDDDQKNTPAEDANSDGDVSNDDDDSDGRPDYLDPDPVNTLEGFAGGACRASGGASQPKDALWLLALMVVLGVLAWGRRERAPEASDSDSPSPT